MNPLPRLVRVGGLVLGAALLGGCSTMVTQRPSAVVVMVKNGASFAPETNDYIGARKAVAALLAERNLRLTENRNDAMLVATVEVREGADGKSWEPVAIQGVAINQQRKRSFPSEESRDDRRPLLSDTMHPSIRLTESNQSLEQSKGSRVR